MAVSIRLYSAASKRKTNRKTYGLSHRTFTAYLTKGLEVSGSKVDATVPGSMGLWVYVSAIFYVSPHHKMIVADADILTQSFSKSGYRAGRVTENNPSGMLSTMIIEDKKIFPEIIPSRYSCTFHKAELGHMATLADGRARKASIWLFQSLEWKVLWRKVG